MKRMALCMLLGSLAACGGLDEQQSVAVWAALEAAGVAQPVSLASFQNNQVFAAPVQCNSGQAISSVLQTHAFAALPNGGADGSASGMITYSLRACRSDDSKMAMQGAVHRSFHGVARSAQKLDDDSTVAASQRWVDRLQGTLTLSGKIEGTCSVDVIRSLSDGAVVYEGTLCDHEAAGLLHDRRPAMGGGGRL